MLLAAATVGVTGVTAATVFVFGAGGVVVGEGLGAAFATVVVGAGWVVLVVDGGGAGAVVGGVVVAVVVAGAGFTAAEREVAAGECPAGAVTMNSVAMKARMLTLSATRENRRRTSFPTKIGIDYDEPDLMPKADSSLFSPLIVRNGGSRGKLLQAVP